MASTTTTRSGSIGRLRRELGLRQVDLARLSGCSLSYIGQLEAGFVPQRSEVIQRVLDVLDQAHHDESAATNRASAKNGEATPHEPV